MTRIRVQYTDADENPIGDPFLEALRSERGAEFRIHGELGRTLNGRHVYLARDLRRDVLIALRLTPVPGQPDDYDVDVAHELMDHAPNCRKCGARFRSNSRFCTQCGADAPVAQETWSPAELRTAVQERADERELEIRDEIRTPSGPLYFATNRRTGVLHALQLVEADGGDFGLAASDFLQRIFAEATAPGVPPRPSR